MTTRLQHTGRCSVPQERQGEDAQGSQGSDAAPSQPATRGEAMPSTSYLPS